MTRASVGESFSRTVTFDADGIRAFAASVEDFNPLHHDENLARRSRFGALTASGTQTVALLMALTATHFSQRLQPLGLEFSVKLKKAVRAGDSVRFAWTVTDVFHKASLGGDLAQLAGEGRNQHEEVVVTATATLLLLERTRTGAAG